ncbi:MAG TPA: lysylphosphatidylglycerol synthase transmembrane domain-containing protein [Solirubrobacteraceae bacterium]|nr:lysylphosphatidylglycerol synthase transmembrane domain-containing protein [Solirubrobacteraceae bacterium]
MALSKDATQPTDEQAEAVVGTPERDAHRLRNGAIWTLALAVLLLGIGLAVPSLRGVLKTASEGTPGWLALGVVLEIFSCLGYVLVVRHVLYRGPPRELRWLAWSEQAFGAIVPIGGAGGLAVGAWAMRAWGVPWARVANRSAVIFLLTSAVNAAVLAIAGFAVWLGLGTPSSVPYGLLPGAIALLGLVLFLLTPLIKAPANPRGLGGRTHQTLHGLGVWVRDTEASAFRRDWRLIGAPAFLLCDIAVLWACLKAVGLSPPIFGMIVAYQIGYLADLIPIPGGIGVLEGGLLGTLVLFHLPATQTAAAVILYHAISLWVPSLGGTVSFARLRRAIAARGPIMRAVPQPDAASRPGSGEAASSEAA